MVGYQWLQSQQLTITDMHGAHGWLPVAAVTATDDTTTDIILTA